MKLAVQYKIGPKRLAQRDYSNVHQLCVYRFMFEFYVFFMDIGCSKYNCILDTGCSKYNCFQQGVQLIIVFQIQAVQLIIVFQIKGVQLIIVLDTGSSKYN